MPLYRVWFATKRRRWLLQGEIAEAIEELIRAIAAEKGIGLLECQGMVDHVRLPLSVDSQTALSRSMNSLKGISSRRIHQRFPELRQDAGTTGFWQSRYGAKEIPDGARTSVAYYRTQWERLEKYER